MKLTKERKVYVAVLGLGLLVLAVDRVALSPAGATAAELTESYALPERSVATGIPTVPETSIAPSGRGLAHRLRTDVADWRDSVGNAFKPSEQWLPPVKVEEQNTRPRTDGEAFVAAHTLKGLTGHRTSGAGALVSGKFLQIGDAINGWVLIEVRTDGAVFEKDGERAELLLGYARVPGLARRDPAAPAPPENK
jgi:hypothetical protein